MTRSRSALLTAAVRLVSERGTTAIPVTDLAEAANVSRQLIYLQFGDRDSLLVAAAADLVTRELLERSEEFQHDDMRPGVLATTRHFAEHRAFYRPMLTGSCAYAMSRTMNQVFRPFNERFLRERFAGLDEATAKDLARFAAAGAGEIVNDWVIDGPEPLDPHEAADRLMRLAAVFPGGYR
ncbi:TetR/AcrR family transcriptional regulator [Actinophytocola sp.]|uniref:TetR/AcrR family transcriptional regulator n=1 Tax=Actinophytocola sp. TaxID=1872138 RepID=UPI002ED21CE7